MYIRRSEDILEYLVKFLVSFISLKVLSVNDTNHRLHVNRYTGKHY